MQVSDRSTAQADLIAQGHAAIHNRDTERLRTINARLAQLLRESPPDVDPFSTIRRA
jgi:molecular chaperone DnaK